MRMALAQIDPLIGDFRGNCAKICRFIEQARNRQCELVIFPELALIGYPPRDLLDKSGFAAHSRRYWQQIQDASRGMGVICGVVAENEHHTGKPLYNAALFFY
jgi:predicted amidohydrolase